MNKENWIWLLTALMVLALSGCSKKTEETSEQPAETTTATAPTPIDQSTVGEVTGKITFEGTKPKLQKIMMDQDPVCVQKHTSPVFAEDNQVNADGTLPNVFVYVKSGAEKYTFAIPADSVVLDQNGCTYQPHVLGIMAGQTLKIVSSDPTTHNIHPMPKNNMEWNMSQPPGAAPIERKFARPEIMVPVKCNQHPWMRAYIGVTKNPFFAVTGSDGKFSIKGLPPGDYEIEAWTSVGGGAGQTQDQKVTLGAKETKTADFVFKAS
jgi:plastocyanin